MKGTERVSNSCDSIAPCYRADYINTICVSERSRPVKSYCGCTGGTSNGNIRKGIGAGVSANVYFFHRCRSRGTCSNIDYLGSCGIIYAIYIR